MSANVIGGDEMSELRKLGALITVGGGGGAAAPVLAEICGKPAICHLLDRVFASWYLDRAAIVVCMTGDAADDAVATTATSYGARIFKGGSGDRVDWLRAASRAFDFDFVLHLEGNRPLCDVLYMDLVLERLRADETIEAVSCHGLPPGAGADSFLAAAVDRAVAAGRPPAAGGSGGTSADAETCRRAWIRPLSDGHVLEGANLVLDSQSDLKRLRRIFEELYRPDELFGLAEIVAFLKQRPELAAAQAPDESEYRRRAGIRA